MDIFAVLSLSLAPGIFWLYFFYKKDTLDPEPKKLVVYMFFLGLLSLVPAALLESFARGIPFLQVIIIAPIIEESIKFTIVRTTIYRSPNFDKPMDGIIYAVAVALGFASAENAYYIVTAYLAPQIALGRSDPIFGIEMIWKVYLIRAFLTVPGHAIWSAMWGYVLGWSKFFEIKKRSIVAKGLLIAVILHALFNFLIFNYAICAIGMLILIPIMWRMLDNRIVAAIKNSPFIVVSKGE